MYPENVSGIAICSSHIFIFCVHDNVAKLVGIQVIQDIQVIKIGTPFDFVFLFSRSLNVVKFDVYSNGYILSSFII